jgi:hypothetical protein
LANSILKIQDRGDVAPTILGEDYANQFAMIVYPEATGYEASNFYLQLTISQHISTFISRATTVFKIKTGDVTTRTGMFVGCSSGSAAANVWTGAVGHLGEMRRAYAAAHDRRRCSVLRHHHV